MVDLNFYKGKKVLVTGHTGFKGSWLCNILCNCGAEVVGVSLEPPTTPNLFSLTGLDNRMVSIIGDICDYEKLLCIFNQYSPEIVFHLAAQPIVRYSYENPRGTYETNVMGTVNVLECVRNTSCVKSFLNITTDKVYANDDILDHPFREDEPLDGFDPYSNSKSCSELVTHSYKKSFFSERGCAISTARAGNVIGGGDFSKDRILPDCFRAVEKKEVIIVRNPCSVRPYQHVLEPLFLYLEIAKKQYKDIAFQGYYNIGPDEVDCISTGELVTKFCTCWGEGASWINRAEQNAPHEATFLKLDNNKVKKIFGWKPIWHIDEAVRKTVEWDKAYLADEKLVLSVMNKQIEEFLTLGGVK